MTILNIYPLELHYPPDIDEAHEAWGASCGPCALAAILGCRVEEVRGLMTVIDAAHEVLRRQHPVDSEQVTYAEWLKAVEALLGDTYDAS